MKLNNVDYIFIKTQDSLLDEYCSDECEIYAVKGKKGYHVVLQHRPEFQEINFKNYGISAIIGQLAYGKLKSCDTDVEFDCEFDIEEELDYITHDNHSYFDAPQITLYKRCGQFFKVMWGVADYGNSEAYRYLEQKMYQARSTINKYPAEERALIHGTFQKIYATMLESPTKALDLLWNFRERLLPEDYANNLLIMIKANTRDIPKPVMVKMLSYTSREYLMKKTDFELYDRLPETITIYRGTDRYESDPRLSWSLSENKARRFESGQMFKTTVKKDRAFAILNDIEQEVLIDVDINECQRI